jgi:hypothetical protein
MHSGRVSDHSVTDRWLSVTTFRCVDCKAMFVASSKGGVPPRLALTISPHAGQIGSQLYM